MKRLILILAVWTASISAAFGQAPDTSAAGRLGRHAFGSYFDSDIDSVDLYNGNLMLNITLFSMPGREISDGLQLSYNARGWTAFPNSSLGWYAGGWRIHNSTGRAFVDLVWWGCVDESTGEWNPVGTYVDHFGIFHYYHSGGPVWGACGGGTPPIEDLSLSPDDKDGSIMTTDSSGYVRIAFKDGTVQEEGSNGSRLITRNGNYLDFNGSLAGTAPQDTLGRTIAYSTDRGGNTTPHCDFNNTSPVAYTKVYTIKDTSGTNRSYTLHLETNHFTFNPVEHCWDHLDDWLTSIDLPNGKHYNFEYNNFQGYLTKVTLPSGAYITYDYAGGNASQTFGDDYIVGRHFGAPGTGDRDWSYVRDSNSAARTTTVTSPELHVVTHQFNSSGEETETRYYNAAGQDPVQKIQTVYTNGRPTQIDTITDSRPDPIKHRTTLQWNSYQQIEQQDDSDWYSTVGSVANRTRTITMYTSTYPIVPTSVDLQVWNGSSYVRTGLTEFDYDDYPVDPTTSTPNKTTPYGNRGNVTTVRRYKDGSNFVTEHLHYDDVGNVVQMDDAMGHHTNLFYTDNFTDAPASHHTYAFPTTVTNLNQSVSLKYDYNTGLPMDATDLRSHHTTYAYVDAMNRPTKITEVATGRVTTYDYNDSNRTINEDVLVADDKHRKTETTMDYFNRPIRITAFDPAGDVSVDAVYDGDGRVKKVSEPYRTGSAVWTESTYDVLNRPLTITRPNSSPPMSFVYDGDTVKQTDEAGNERQIVTNPAGQAIRVYEPNPDLPHTFLETDYSYFAFGPLYQVTQGGQTRTFNYDWLGRMLNELHPETTTSPGHSNSYSYSYNDVGLVTSRTDVLGRVTEYSYDNLSRLTGVNYSDSTPDVSYAYDQNSYTGLLTSVAVAGVTSSTLAYDAGGNLTGEAVILNGVGTFTTGYSYDYDGRLLTATYPSGRVVSQTYASNTTSATNRISGLSETSPSTVTFLQSVQDNAAGLITSRTLSSGIAETRSFNSGNQLTRISAASNGATLLDMSYGYGTANDGRIRSRTDAVQPEHSAVYTYDPIGRLTEAGGVDSSWDITWSLDRYGNRTHQTPGGLAIGRLASPTFTYTNNRIDGVTYDAAGNVTYDNTNHYCYDAENRLTELDASCDGIGSIQYAYDAAGRRIKRLAAGVTTYYIYGLTGLMSEFSTDATVSNHTSAGSNDRIQYRVGEQTGTAVMLMAADGTPRENNRVFPFGEPWNSFEKSDNSEKFTTYQHDDESGLNYAMARHYNRLNGRFMTPDPGHVGASIGDPQSWNAYVYSRNDPVNLVDPTGMIYNVCFDGNDCAELSDDGYASWYNRIPANLTLIMGDITFSVSVLAPPPGQSGTILCNSNPCGTVFYYIDQRPNSPVDTGTGGDGGGGQPLPNPAPPSNAPGRIQTVNQCAAANAASIASIFHANPSNFWVGALLGNDASTLSNLVFGPTRARAAESLTVSNPTKYSLVNAGANAAGKLPTGGKVYEASGSVLTPYGKAIEMQPVPKTVGMAVGETVGKLAAIFTGLKAVFDAGAYIRAEIQCATK